MEITSKEDLINIIKEQDEKINFLTSRLDEISTREETTETKEDKEEIKNDTTEEIDEKQVDEIEQMFSQD